MMASSEQQDDPKGKGKQKFIIPSDESDDAWQEGDQLSDEDHFSEVADEEEEQYELIEEDPFEPVYATPSAEADGVIVEALSLDNILPAGSRRRQK